LILPGENRLKSFCFASLVIALLTLSLIVAVPVRGAVMSSSSESGVPAAPVPTQVEPTLLAGYKAVGVLSPSVPVMVTVGIPLQDEQSLEYLSQQISMPGSPLYRHFLSQAQVQTFLPTSEYQAALAYLEQRGLIIMSSSLDSVIIAEGTASQVSQTMGLSIETYSNGTSSYYSASGVSPIQGAYVDVSNVTAVLLSHPPDLATARPAPSIVSGSSQSNQTAPGESYPLTDLQSVYNATALYSRGDNGAGYTAGILDFYGDPYIAGQLQYFDQLYGVPNAPLNVIPIEAYDPGLGTAEGWAPEISLDVESAHAMAPGATIDLYIANGALPLSAAIAAIVAQDKVGDLSQSFGFPESQLSSMTASSFDLNIVLTDQFYMLGSAEGITFISSTGDVGGSGGAGGPEGSVAYPSTSPYVVAVGGTTTYLTFDGTAVSSSYETAWSNYGFVPDGVNYGGGTGGVSDLEPRPWYQASLTAPAGFAQGREVPDLSLNANVYPGIDVVVPGNLTEVSGGTSESSPLFAGLLTLLMTSAKSELGLINPGLYSLAQNPSLYPKVYHPITFGYIIPWVSQPGYNMATGWGAPNIGEMAHYSLGGVSTGGLGVNVTVTEKGVQPFEVLPGAALSISAKVTSGASTVGTGSFNAELDTLTGTLMTVPLTFSPTSGTWVGQLTSPANASGFAYVTVKGSSGGVSGTGFASIFAGYLADFITPSPDAPYDTQFGITLVANITTLDGKSVGAGTVSFSASSYSLSSNTYTKVATLSGSTLGQYDNYWSGTLLGDYAYGPMVFAGNDGVYGYLPIINGVGMQSSFIETSVLAEPGVVAPGQTLFVLATLSAPGNMPDVLSLETGLPVYYDLEVGSNVTVSLVSQSGKTVATQPIYENSFLSTVLRIQGELTVPAGTAPGLYDVILRSSFDSYTLDKSIDGYYFGQVYVGASQSSPRINISPSTLYEGQTVSVTAKIDYANGTSVKYGMYSAAVYPKDLQNAYNALTETIQVPLWFDTATGLWTGNVTLPSEYNSGVHGATLPPSLRPGPDVPPADLPGGLRERHDSRPQDSDRRPVPWREHDRVGSVHYLVIPDRGYSHPERRHSHADRGLGRVGSRREQRARGASIQPRFAAADRLYGHPQCFDLSEDHTLNPCHSRSIARTEPELQRDVGNRDGDGTAGRQRSGLPGRGTADRDSWEPVLLHLPARLGDPLAGRPLPPSGGDAGRRYVFHNDDRLQRGGDGRSPEQHDRTHEQHDQLPVLTGIVREQFRSLPEGDRPDSDLLALSARPNDCSRTGSCHSRTGQKGRAKGRGKSRCGSRACSDGAA
jgi:subtilase family serine protease